MRKKFSFHITAMTLLAVSVAVYAVALTPGRTLATASSVQATAKISGQTERILRIFFWQAPTILNPQLSTGDKDVFASRITYEPLASFNKEGILVPFLAAEIPSLENGGVASDGKSVIWKLKPGVRWADGKLFTADDVLFTYEFITNPATAAPTVSAYQSIERVEVIDALNVKITFKDVNPAWAGPFVGQTGMILPRHIFKDHNNNKARQAPANTRPIGTGPYYVSEFNVEDVLIIGKDMVKIVKIVYKANRHFREKEKPYFSRVELHGGGDAAMAARALLVDGSVDFAWNLQVGSKKLSEMEVKGKGKVIATMGPFVERLLVNFTDPYRETETGERSSLRFPHPFFREKRVRQAFAHAIDRKAIAELYGEMARPTTNILVEPPQYNSPNTANLYPFNLKRAAQLFDEAGWIDSDGDGIRDKNGTRMKVLYQTSVNPIRQQTQELIKKALESVGVEVKLKMIDASIFFDTAPDNIRNSRHFYADLEEYYHQNKTPDPDVYMERWICAQASQEANKWMGNNDSRWCNTEYDALFEQVISETDLAKRRQMFIRLNDLLVEDVGMIPLVQRALPNGVSHTLEGVDITPWDSPLWNIKDWRRK